MKHLSATPMLLLLLLILAGLQPLKAQKSKMKDKTKASEAEFASNTTSSGMQGAYTMLSQKLSTNGQDSVMNVEQMKIYTDRYFMYAHAIPGDSLAEYGIGKYVMQNGKVIEYSMFTATNGAHLDTFTVDVNRDANGYTQVINFPPDNQGRNFILTESYKNSSRNMKSPLDGAWKMTRASYYATDGKQMVNENPTQYKVYQSGHYMFGNTSLDSATKKPVSAYGYGTFEMNGPGQITETGISSTFRYALVGKPVQLKIEMKDPDHYQQTIEWADGTRSVEEYERLK